MENKYVKQFKKGSLEMVLLCLIAQHETYGYEIISQLNTTGGKIFGNAKEGTIYPILYRLEAAGYIQSRLASSTLNGGSKKYYNLTESGHLMLQELLVFWNDFVGCVNNFVASTKKNEV
ncbi:MAG: PadR family transcriptional regulator [Oscillospiraceae bacterium]|jgi:PadR family transcriptional regulator PadR|nr:PadR family transcriptional regulator [Oscillospiraceae bacterium]